MTVKRDRQSSFAQNISTYKNVESKSVTHEFATLNQVQV
jgi:hypothetical protein